MWREITEADLLGVLNATEKQVYLTAVKGPDQNVFTDLSTSVVHFCRGYIADNVQNRLAEGVTLPDRVIRPAMHLLRKDLLTRLGREVDEDRRKDAAEALRFFERVADGKVMVEQPTGATDDSSPVQSIETISTHERQATRDKLSGL